MVGVKSQPCVEAWAGVNTGRYRLSTNTGRSHAADLDLGTTV